MSRTVRVAGTSDLAPGTAIRLGADLLGADADIALVRAADGSFHAVDDGCTHFVASLSRGRVVDGCLVCPAHQAAYDLRTGEERSGRVLEPVAVHRVEVRGDGVYLVLP